MLKRFGLGFSYQIKFDNGSSKWIPGKQIDLDVLTHYNQNLKQKATSKATLNPNKILLTLAILFALLNVISANK